MPKLLSTPRGLLKRPRTVFKPVFSVTKRDSSGKKVSTVNLNTGVKTVSKVKLLSDAHKIAGGQPVAAEQPVAF